MRNEFEPDGKWGIPLIKSDDIDLTDVRLIACSDTRCNDVPENTMKGVHFFADDYRFSGVYNIPIQSWPKFRQYAFLLSPDFSLYMDMPIWRQIENTAKNRWCGAWWQSKGAKVIPTISWAGIQSFDFCFDGVEHGSIVAVSTVGCLKAKLRFIRGYDEMLKRIEPKAIIVFGKPFQEMSGNTILVDYRQSRKVVR